MSSKGKLLVIDSIHPCFIEQLSDFGFTVVDGTKLSEEEILQQIHEYTGIEIRSRLKVNSAFLERATSLKFIARAGAGMESIDEDYANQKGIICLNAPEGNRDAVGEHAIAMLLSLFNNLNRADKQIREGKWEREFNRGIELKGKTIAIIGYGNMGSAFAAKLKGFGVTILAYDKYKKGFGSEGVTESTLEDIYEKADVVSLHVPLTEETRYLVKTSFVERFKKNFFLINTARGKIVNTEDLVKALQSGKIKGACLDVLEYESHSFYHFDAAELPDAYHELIKSSKVVLSPHVGGWTFESWERIARVLVEKVKAL